MKKLKMFFVASALVLTTVGVFAGKSKFVISGVFAQTSTTPTYVQLDGAASLVHLTETQTGNQVQIIDGSTPANTYPIVVLDGGVYKPLYATGF